MKNTLITALTMVTLAVPVMAQVVYIGGTTENGDLENGGIAPFTGIASSYETGVINDHTTGTTAGGVMKVDLQANTGEGQWKLLHTSLLVNRGDGPSGLVLDVEDDVLAGNAFDAEMWVYIPTGTGLGTPPTAAVTINLEHSTDGGASFFQAAASTGSVDITGLATDTWHRVGFNDVTLPAGTTHVHTRAWFLSTVNSVNGKDAFDSGTMPADWAAAGYSGAVYFDDFRVESVSPPDPNIVICEDVRNGDFEGATLVPWNPASGAGAIETTIVHSGAQSLSFDMSANNSANGTSRWKQMNLGSGAHPGVAGDRVKISAWVYTPSTTTFGLNPGDRGNLNFTLRSDKDGSGQGNQGSLQFNLKTMTKDEWVFGENVITLQDGAATVSSFNLGGWNVETENGQDQVALGYGGFFYLDDVKVINMGPPPPGVLVNAEINNGDIEDGVQPWNVNGAGTASSDFDHTSGSGQSVKVDLTANNSNERWKGLKSQPISQSIGSFTKADISMWVYIPTATTFGPTANINLEVRDGGTAKPGLGPSLNLTTADRDVWIEVAAYDIDVTDFVDSLAINNWNLQTVPLLGPEGSTVRSDGSDGTTAPGTAFNPLSDLVGPAAPGDWIAEGYSGFIYIDDINVKLKGAPITGPIHVNFVAYDSVTDAVTINYNSTFPEGVDVYYSDDNLSTWTADGFGPTGDAQELMRTSADPNRFYILVEPFGTPPANPNP